MKLKLLTVVSHKEDWSESATDLYLEKINPFVAIEIEALKSKKLERENSELKKEAESEQLLKKLSPTDYVILCDEHGKGMDSPQFSKKLVTAFESGKRQVVFVVGGAFGVSAAIKKRADLTVSLSTMTMNHLVARVMLLEQIYRAIMIWKNKPYHNA